MSKGDREKKGWFQYKGTCEWKIIAFIYGSNVRRGREKKNNNINFSRRNKNASIGRIK